ncbi:MAG TPA: efflux RND transporter periplasmic adaptor subunit, partial [Egibacteraceae bacterium]
VVALTAGLVLALAACTGDDRPLVEVERVTSGEVTETVAAPAQVEAAARQEVAAAVPGVVVALEVADGDTVEAGQTIVRLDSSQVELAQQQAAAAQAAAAEVGGVAVRGGGGDTLAAVEEAVAELDRSSKPRIAEAREQAQAIADPEQRAAALAAVDAVETSYLTSRAVLLATGEALAAQQEAVARSLSDAVNAAVEQATAAQRAQAQAAAAAAAGQAEELVLTAPFSGTVQLGTAAASDGAGLIGGLGADGLELPDSVAGLASAAGAPGESTLRVGAPVAAGQTLFTVFDLSQRYVRADVDEIDAPEIAVGQRARVLVDALPDQTLVGVVESVRVEAATTEAGGIGYPTRIRLLGVDDGSGQPSAAPLDALRVGMTASAEIITGRVTADLVVPSRALLRREGGDVVHRLDGDRVRVVEVEVLALGEDSAAVASDDLERGDAVVVSGYEDLEDGAQVRTR